MKALYYIGPEAKVWHASALCPSLQNPLRYWTLRRATGKKADEIMAKRRQCRRCAS